MLFVVRFAGEPDIRWRALDARNPEEARVQALRVSNGDLVQYGAADPETGGITIVGTVGGLERPRST